MKILQFIVISLLMTGLQAQSPVVFIYDASGSMWGEMGDKTKVEIAREVMATTVDQISADRAIGLVVYGHRKKGDCQDVEEVAPIQNDQQSAIKRKILEIKPLGRTPLAASAEMTIDRLKKDKLQATIILLTDGVESCGGDLCRIVQKAREAGIIFKLHIVGFDIDPKEVDPLKCAAEAGDGQYFDASDEDGLYEVMQEAVKQSLDSENGNFSVSLEKNGAGVDGWVRVFDGNSGDEVMGRRTYGDSAFFALPKGEYTLNIKPLEGSSLRSRKVRIIRSTEEARHETFSFNAGGLSVTATNNGEGWDASVKVKDIEGEWVDGARTYGRTTEFELDPGTYQVEISALRVKGEGIQRSKEVFIEPGANVVLTEDFASGILKIGMSSGIDLVDAVVKVNGVDGTQVASGRTYTSEKTNPKSFILSPGTYEVTIKGLKDHADKKKSIKLDIQKGKEHLEMVKF